MDSHTLDVYVALDIFFLLLIGVGPKIALVPFLDITSDLDAQTKARVTRIMLRTATVVSLVLLALGELLRKLLHFSRGSLSVAGGIVLFIIAVSMILKQEDTSTEPSTQAEDPMRLAVYPLAVPYLLNPAGIVALVTISGDANTVGNFVVVLALLAIVLILDVLVFRWANRVGEHLDKSRMLVVEKVFGFLLAALAVQLALNGLADVGVINLIGH